MSDVISVNGRFVAEDEAAVSAVDRGFTLGDGVFETMRATDGVILDLEKHMARLRRGADVLGIRLPAKIALADGLEAALSRLPVREATVRLTLSRGADRGRGVGDPEDATPTVVIRAGPFTPYPAEAYARGMSATIVSVRRNEASPLSRIKSCSYADSILARREAAREGCDVAVMLNTRGELACADVANLFVVSLGGLVTPPPESGALPGITRGRVLNAARDLDLPAMEEPFPPDVLHQADEAFITNTIMGLMPLTSVGGRAIGTGSPGPVTARLQEALARPPDGSGS